jgi:hypothetical protein
MFIHIFIHRMWITTAESTHGLAVRPSWEYFRPCREMNVSGYGHIDRHHFAGFFCEKDRDGACLCRRTYTRDRWMALPASDILSSVE